jgi:hypothetical protein
MSDLAAYPSLVGAAGVLAMVGVFHIVIIVAPWLSPSSDAADDRDDGDDPLWRKR